MVNFKYLLFNLKFKVMKKSFFLSCLLIFALCAVNVLAAIPEKESAFPGASMTTVDNDHSRPFIATIT